MCTPIVIFLSQTFRTTDMNVERHTRMKAVRSCSFGVQMTEIVCGGLKETRVGLGSQPT